MGMGTIIARNQSNRDAALVQTRLDGMSDGDLRDLADMAWRTYAPQSEHYFEKADPRKDHLLRVLMVRWLNDRKADEARRAAS